MTLARFAASLTLCAGAVLLPGAPTLAAFMEVDDTFDGTSIDTSLWTIANGTPSVSGGKLTMSATSTASTQDRLESTFSAPRGTHGVTRYVYFWGYRALADVDATQGSTAILGLREAQTASGPRGDAARMEAFGGNSSGPTAQNGALNVIWHEIDPDKDQETVTPLAYGTAFDFRFTLNQTENVFEFKPSSSSTWSANLMLPAGGTGGSGSDSPRFGALDVISFDQIFLAHPHNGRPNSWELDGFSLINRNVTNQLDAAIPEPGSLLALCGLGLAILVRRRLP